MIVSLIMKVIMTLIVFQCTAAALYNDDLSVNTSAVQGAEGVLHYIL